MSLHPCRRVSAHRLLVNLTLGLWIALGGSLVPDGRSRVWPGSTTPAPLPGTRPLRLGGRHRLATGRRRGQVPVARDRQVDRAPGRVRQRDLSSPEKYAASIEPNRQRLAHILGVRDPRVPFDGMELVGHDRPSRRWSAEAPDYKVFAVRWPAFGDVHGEGLLLVPTGRSPRPTWSRSRRRPDARDARRAGRGRAGRVAVRPAVGRKWLSRARAGAGQSPHPSSAAGRS